MATIIQKAIKGSRSALMELYDTHNLMKQTLVNILFLTVAIFFADVVIRKYQPQRLKP